MKILRLALVLGLLGGCADFEEYTIVQEGYGEEEFYEVPEGSCPQISPTGQFAPLTPVPVSPTGPQPSGIPPAGQQTQEPPY